MQVIRDYVSMYRLILLMFIATQTGSANSDDTDDDVQQALVDVERVDDDVARAVMHAEHLMEAYPFVDGSVYSVDFNN